MSLLKKLFSILIRKEPEEYPIYFSNSEGLVYQIYYVLSKLKESETSRNFIISDPHEIMADQSLILPAFGINRSYNVRNIQRVLRGLENIKILQNIGKGYYTLRKIKFTPEADKKLVFHANTITITTNVKHYKWK
jgi:hypothetical protein